MRSLAHVNPDGRVVRFWASELADLGRKVTLGPGCILEPYSFIEDEAEVGENALLCHHVRVRRGARVGALVEVGPGALIGPDAVILDRAKVGAGAVIGQRAVVAAGAVVPGNARVA
jgi:UDP-3-O-[3-hydroxymyristoyl] glucosamine N-acyltransferase